MGFGLRGLRRGSQESAFNVAAVGRSGLFRAVSTLDLAVEASGTLGLAMMALAQALQLRGR